MAHFAVIVDHQLLLRLLILAFSLCLLAPSTESLKALRVQHPRTSLDSPCRSARSGRLALSECAPYKRGRASLPQITLKGGEFFYNQGDLARLQRRPSKDIHHQDGRLSARIIAQKGWSANILASRNRKLVADDLAHGDALNLLAFKNAVDTLHGDLDGVLRSWSISGTTNTACRWSNIDCDANDRVISVNLNDFLYAGVLVPELSHLSQLQTLNLANNNLTGNVSSLGNSLTALQSLDLSNNSLSGSVPKGLATYAGLRHLSLSVNCLTGELPSELGQLVSLQTLLISDTYSNQCPTKGIGGQVPASFANLINLKVLDLSNNNLGGVFPYWLHHLTFLEHLHLGSNNLEGGISPLLGKLAHLVTLNLGNNPLSGSIPGELGSLANLTRLELQSMATRGVTAPLGSPSSLGLTGNLPLQFAGLQKLEYLDLSYNYLSGNFPEVVCQLPSLSYIDLSGNFLEGVLPKSIGRCSALQTLTINDNNFEGPLPSVELCSLPLLKQLNLNSNPIRGTLSKALAACKKLEKLSFANMGLVGPIPPELGNMSALTLLELTSNGLNGTIPRQLCSIRVLQDVRLASNNFDGTIPKWWSECAALSSLDLSLNFFTGKIPPELGKVRHLSSIYLSFNKLTGSLPPSLANLRISNIVLEGNQLTGRITPSFIRKLAGSLVTFNVGGNRMEGPVPREFQNCSWLSQLIISDNRFHGPLPLINVPAEWDTLGFTGLESLLAQGNRFTGTIPKEYGLCKSLLFFDVSNNNLAGRIPSELGLLTNLMQLNVDFNNLSGPIPVSFGNLSNLLNLTMRHTNLSGSIPAGLFALPSILQLDLSHNNFDSQLPEMPSLPSLYTLILSNAGLKGPVPPGLLLGKNLSTIILANNSLTGEIPGLFGNVSIKVLDFSNNQLRGSIPAGVGQITTLRRLSLGGNQLNGSVPQSLSMCRSLVYLELPSNELSGGIPIQLASLPRLSTVQLARNKFSGPFPVALAYVATLQVLDLSNNLFSGSLPPDLGNLTLLKGLNLQHNQLSGTIPVQLGQLALLSSLNLADNNLRGNVPWELGSLSKLRVLNLANNSLSGALPFSLNGLEHLTSFNVSFNNLVGGPLKNANLGTNPYLGNVGMCGGQLVLCPPPKLNSLPTQTLVGILIGSIVGGVVLAILLFGLLIWQQHRRSAGRLVIFKNHCSHVTYAQLAAATDNFNDKFTLGKGGFGTVFRAKMPDGSDVAVKRLERTTRQREEFEAEMYVLGQLGHRHVVPLLGCYTDPELVLLLYPYMSGGSLDRLIFKAKDPRFKLWDVRLEIALGIARGIKYLHHDVHPPIIHRDIKPANVLLDESLVPYVADFGLARVVDVTKTHMSTNAMGTIGYVAPEYAQRGRLTVKSDVFSFGVVLLQILTGKRPTDGSLPESGGLLVWAATEQLSYVLDKSLIVTAKNKRQVTGALKLALLCTAFKPDERPSMDEAVYFLENLDNFSSRFTDDKK